MHADEIDTDVGLVRRLLEEQFPAWAELPLEPVRPLGTDNALYRLGQAMVVRLPRRPRTAITLEKELRWLPRLGALLPLAIPRPLAHGAPVSAFPFTWAVYTWLPGETATLERIPDPQGFTFDLAGFLIALQRAEPAGGPAAGEHNFFRGEPLVQRDGETRAAIARLAGRVDERAATAIWEAALGAPEWMESPVWIHGDLDARNLLVRDGRLAGVLDFGSLGVGDPACDVAAAWKAVPATAREAFRSRLGVDDATWVRARGWVLSQAVGALSYYTSETNAVLVGEARRWLADVLACP